MWLKSVNRIWLIFPLISLNCPIFEENIDDHLARRDLTAVVFVVPLDLSCDLHEFGSFIFLIITFYPHLLNYYPISKIDISGRILSQLHIKIAVDLNKKYF